MSTRELKPLTKLQTLEIMICETQNEITKDEILVHVAKIEELAGNSAGRNQQNRLMIETKIRALKRTLKYLEEMKKEEAAAVPMPLIEAPKDEGILKS